MDSNKTMTVDSYLNSTQICHLALLEKKGMFPSSLKIKNSSNHNYLSVCHSDMQVQLFSHTNILWTNQFKGIMNKKWMEKYSAENIF